MWGIWEGSTDHSQGTSKAPWMMVPLDMAWQEILNPSVCLFHLPATLPELSALFPAIYQAPFPVFISLTHSFVPVIALKCIFSQSDSISVL